MDLRFGGGGSGFDGSSFYDFLITQVPHSAPFSRPAPTEPSVSPSNASAPDPRVAHGTTVLALTYDGGAVMAGDRMATEGYQVSARRIEKVYRADDHSAIAIAGAAGPCLELARLFQTELEHYEKLEGIPLTTEGKANKLAQMVRGNLPMAFQGLVVVPIFVGYDPKQGAGRIFKYDITGGRYEETDYYATGSGGRDAKNTIKKLYRPNLPVTEAIKIALEALYDASEEDIGTGGPDLVRGIFPTVKLITSAGVQDVEENKIRSQFADLIEARKRTEQR